MNISKRVHSPILLAVMIGILPAVAAAGDCDRPATTFDLKIKVKNKKPTEVEIDNKDAETLVVCVNDTIVWKVSGNADESFFIEFREDSPLSGDKKKNHENGKVEATVIGPARADPYKYDIGVDGGEVWDPRIIVER